MNSGKNSQFLFRSRGRNAPRVVNRKHILERINRQRRGRSLIGLENNSLVRYYRKIRIETTLVPATWAHVILISFLYAFSINFCKFAYYQQFGKPKLQLANAQLEQQYDAVLQQIQYRYRP